MRNTVDETMIDRPAFPALVTDPAGDAILNVDWYSFTDRHGNKWLVEGIGQNKVKPAAYHEGL
jgi:hypothetical protein